MRIALLVVTLASVAGPAIAPEAYLSPQSQPQPQPRPDPSPPDTEPTPEPTKKHIALGRNEFLGDFLFQLQARLASQNIRVYLSDQWHMVGLSDVEASIPGHTFHIAFEQAITRADHIHFNLQGIPDPISYAKQYGSGDLYAEGTYVTAWELYHIYQNPAALAKTTFYPSGIVVP